jgi:hypothetical protein
LKIFEKFIVAFDVSCTNACDHRFFTDLGMSVSRQKLNIENVVALNDLSVALLQKMFKSVVFGKD